MGDVYDETPSAPIVLQTPRIEKIPKPASCTPEWALSSIGRIARLAQPSAASANQGKLLSDKENEENKRPGIRGDKNSVSPVETVMSVRQLRAERDELRRRERLVREECLSLKRKLKYADDTAKRSMDGELGALAEKMDGLIGVQPPGHLSALDRLRIGVDGVQLIHEEIASLQRQHGSVSLLLRQEERRTLEERRHARVQPLKREAQEESTERMDEGQSWEAKRRCEVDREELKSELKNYASISGQRAHDMIGSAALRYARSKEYEILKMEVQISELEQDRDKWKKLHEQRTRHPGTDALKGELFKWKSAPLDLQRHYSTDLRSLAYTLPTVGRKKTLPPISQSSGVPSKLLSTRSGIPALPTTRSGGFDCRPVPAEIKARLNRVQDQLLRDPSLGKAEKEEHREVLDNFLTGDPRDVEITNLKIRLVRAEKERAEMAARATQDKRDAQIKLHQSARILEQAQSLTEQLKEAVLTTRVSGEDGEEMLQFAVSMMDTFLARVEKLTLD